MVIFFCFAIGQMSQWATLLHFMKGTILFMSSSLALEGCPNLAYQKSELQATELQYVEAEVFSGIGSSKEWQGYYS